MYDLSESCQIKDLPNIYNTYFGRKAGVFVDVGAFDGITFSNTWGLTQMNWRGLLIEPLPKNMASCKFAYQDFENVDFLEACIGATYGETLLYPDGACSTSCKRTAEIFNMNGDNAVICKTYPLNLALLHHNIPKRFELLSIDVEGNEPDVLDGFEWSLWKPKMIIIEVKVNDINICKEQVEEWFSKTPYELIYSDDLNNIYWLD